MKIDKLETEGENITLKEFDEQFKVKEVDKHFIIPINNLLLQLKLVEKDKDRKNVTTPYIKAEILIPYEVGRSVASVLSSDWKLALLGIKFKKKKKVKK